MKCPRCRRTMQRKSYENDFYYECPACGKAISKPAAAVRAEQEQEETSNNENEGS